MQLAIDQLPNIDLAAKAEVTRRAVGDGTETIGAAATEFGREAARIGRDAAKLSREAARRALLMAASSSKALRQASTERPPRSRTCARTRSCESAAARTGGRESP